MIIQPAAPRRSSKAAQQSYDAPHPRTRQTGSEIGKGSTLSNLRKRRIRHYHTSNPANIGPLCDCEHPDRNQLPGRRPDDRGAEDAAVLARDDLDMAAGLAFGLSAVILLIRPAQHPDDV